MHLEGFCKKVEKGCFPNKTFLSELKKSLFTVSNNFYASNVWSGKHDKVIETNEMETNTKGCIIKCPSKI